MAKWFKSKMGTSIPEDEKKPELLYTLSESINQENQFGNCWELSEYMCNLRPGILLSKPKKSAYIYSLGDVY